jgi:hypothetical protein
MPVSADYAHRIWRNHERQNAQARAPAAKGEYILPVLFDETVIPGLPLTVHYKKFALHGNLQNYLVRASLAGLARIRLYGCRSSIRECPGPGESCAR